MSEQSRKTASNKFARHLRSYAARPLGVSYKIRSRRSTSIVAGIFSIGFAILVVWAWQIVSASDHKASADQPSLVVNSSNLHTSLNTQSGSADVSMNSDGNSPADVTVNGQPVKTDENGNVSKHIKSGNGNDTTINIHVDNGSTSNNNDQDVNIFTHTRIHSRSSTSTGGDSDF